MSDYTTVGARLIKTGDTILVDGERSQITGVVHGRPHELSDAAGQPRVWLTFRHAGDFVTDSRCFDADEPVQRLVQ